MATTVGEVMERAKKRRKKEREKPKRKFLVGDRVEVRSTEEGFCGSWHCATVIGCGDSTRQVRYDNLLSDDSSEQLTEFINVSPMIEGVVPEGGIPITYRNLIKPLVTPKEVCKMGLYYGLCVDALVDEAWWEGVIFDHEDGNDERLVFFPDLGDEQVVKIENIRITNDWDEVREIWKYRGSWVLLELIEEYGEEWPVLVSVKQIWYELRMKEAFQSEIKEWTCRAKSMWGDLVLQAIQENLNLCAEHVLNVIGFDKGMESAETSSKRTRTEVGYSKPKSVDASVEYELVVALPAKPIQTLSLEHKLDAAKKVSVSQEEESTSPKHVPGENLGPLDADDVDDFALDGIVYPSTPHLEVDALDKAIGTNANRRSEDNFDLIADLGYDFNQEGGEVRKVRGIVEGVASGNGSGKNPIFCRPNDNTTSSYVDLSHDKEDSGNAALNEGGETQDGRIIYDTRHVGELSNDAACSEHSDRPTCSKSRVQGGWLPADLDILPGAENCPQALKEYYLGDHSPEKTKQARMHLSRLGWKVEYKNDRNVRTRSLMVRFRYIQPTGKIFYSLVEVCKFLARTTEKDLKLSPQNGCQAMVDASIDQSDFGTQQILVSKTHVELQGCDSGVCSPPAVMDISDSEFEQQDNALLEIEAPGSRISEKGRLPPLPGLLVVKPENCPQAVIDLYEYESKRKEGNDTDIKIQSLRMKAKKHLCHVGWRFHYVRKNNRREMRYVSPPPKCKTYFSLRTAYRAYMDEEGWTLKSMKGGVPDEEIMALSDQDATDSSACKKLSSDITCSQLVKCAQPINVHIRKCSAESSCSSQSEDNLQFDNMLQGKSMESHKRRRSSHLDKSTLLQHQDNELQSRPGTSQWRGNTEFGDVQVKRVGREHRKDQKTRSFSLIHGSGKHVYLERENGDATKLSCYRMKRLLLTKTSGSKRLKKNLRGSRILRKQYDRLVSYPARVLRSSKRARQAVTPNPAHHTPRSVLSWLIENNAVLPRAKVRYLRKHDNHQMKEGRITRDGIKCKCCKMVFGLSTFETHAGSTSHRPSASIFLEDGRSLLDCQKQVVQSNKLIGFKRDPHKRIKRNQLRRKNDYICSVCHFGGDLVLCDQCPSSFHLSCIGLEDLPEGQWFCPSCRCGICGQSEFDGNCKQFTEKTALYCDQCRREYHVGCIKKRELVKLDRCPEVNWFCSSKCEKIFLGLSKILGKSIPLGVDNLSWTILKSYKDDYLELGASDIEAITEHRSKLNVALAVMHECFEPIKEPGTKRDMVKDILFNNTSELNRLNFWGFYTVLLEREDEMISVATVRIHGEKVAEAPLIATRVQYRRQGMCRILLDALEKTLAELGVERLFLPAVPQVLHTWTSAFGFSQLTNFERLEFLPFTFLDFQGTTMCQKVLRMRPTAQSMEARDMSKLVNELDHCEEAVDIIRLSSSSEVTQDETSEQLSSHAGESNSFTSVGPATPLIQAPVVMRTEQSQESCEDGIMEKSLWKNYDENNNQQNHEEVGLVEKCWPRSSDGINGLRNGPAKFYTRKRTAVIYN